MYYKYKYLQSIAIAAICILIIYSSLSFVYNAFCVASSLISLFFVLLNILLYLHTKERKHLLFTPMLLMTWWYFLRPYLKSYETTYYGRTIPPEYLNEMAMFSAIALISLFIGYYISFNRTKVSSIASTSFRFTTSTIGYLVLLFLFLSIIQRFASIFFPEVLSSIGQLIQILYIAPSITVALLVLYYLRKGRSPIILTVTIIYILIEYFFRVAETLFAYIILLFIGGLLVYVFEKKKIPYLFLLVFFILNFPIYNTRSKFRAEKVLDRWYYGKSQGFFEIVSEGIENISLIYSDWSWDIFEKKNVLEEETDRMEQVSYLGQCVYMHTSGKENFKGGSTFWWLPIAPVPRFIFPWKPENLLATKVAQQYGLKGESYGAMNFPMLAEYYINFGFLGMIIFSFLQGLAIRWILLKVNYGFGDINLIILLNLMSYLIKVEANITLVFGGILQVLIFWWILLKFIGNKKELDVKRAN